MSATTHLPAAPWRDHAGLVRLIDALSVDGAAARFVGGAVRDTMLGRDVEDVDIATLLPPEVVMRRAEAAGLKPVPTGLAHGTVTVVAEGRPFEVTTLRRDVATDGRRATIAFADDWQEDAARRDFTINALYADPASGEIFDWFGGLADLAAGRVRFIGDAGTRIDEDHLRILRYFRFRARFGSDDDDQETLAVIAGRAAKLRSLSRERVADELIKLLALPDPAPAIRQMVDIALFDHIAPEIDSAAPARVAAMAAAERATDLPADAARRLMALLPPDASVAEQIAAKLKLSNRLRKRIGKALGDDWAGLAPRQLAYRIGVEGAMDRALLLGDGRATSAALDGWAVPQLPLSGGDIIKHGVSPGPDVARLLRVIEDQWVAEDFPDAARTRIIASDCIAQSGSAA